MYNIKKWCAKEDRKLTLDDCLIEFSRTALMDSTYDKSNIILVDDVIGTGCSMAKCMQLLGRQCEAMCIAVDWETFNSYNWDE